MRLRFLNSSSGFILLYIVLNISYQTTECNPITNTNLSERSTEFSTKEDLKNSTNVQTLQKQKIEYYANFTPVRNPVKFKETPDNMISGSSYSRGLATHEHPGYAFHDYEDEPHYYGNDYHIPDSNHHGFHHYNVEHFNYGHHDGHHLGHHYKYNHALAAKTVLWPIAGLALLGAAAALVTNPILLQIGVATGKRRRRDTEEVFDPDTELKDRHWDFKETEDKDIGTNKETNVLGRKIIKNYPAKRKKENFKQMTLLRDKTRFNLNNPTKYNNDDPESSFVQVPLIINNVQ